MPNRAYPDYKPLYRRPRHWPVVQLSRNIDKFKSEVAQRSFERVLMKCPDKTSLREEIETTMFREKLRIKRNPWRVDPPDENEFWDGVKKRLLDSAADPTDKVEKDILKEILLRYAGEIASTFKPSRYRLARSISTAGFRRLLNAAKLRTIAGTFKGKHTLRDNITIHGQTEQIRKLAMKGTIVMVPTHFSNLDSVLMGWIIYELGLPPFIYGAGLNLFNIRLFAYFMNSLGAYKVDRRKKNLPYLEALKSYSALAIHRGCHSLFFPGGTRSRSGKIEERLKLGLLGTALEAQRMAYQEVEGTDKKARKIFIVPVTLNYNFVLEAPVLIRQFLERQGQERFYIELDEYSTSYKIFTFILKFFTKDSKLSVSIGKGLDLFGNYVDEEGNSLGKSGQIIDTGEYFMTNGKINENEQRESEYTRRLAEVIIKEFRRINRVFASHLVAYTCFQMLRKRFRKLDLYNFLRLPDEELVIPYDSFKETFSRLRERIFEMQKEDKIDVATHMSYDIDEIIKTGIQNVGMYHVSRPVILTKNKDVSTQDLNNLYYYHNRLDGYGLEEYI